MTCFLQHKGIWTFAGCSLKNMTIKTKYVSEKGGWLSLLVSVCFFFCKWMYRACGLLSSHSNRNAISLTSFRAAVVNNSTSYTWWCFDILFDLTWVRKLNNFHQVLKDQVDSLHADEFPFVFVKVSEVTREDHGGWNSAHLQAHPRGFWELYLHSD